MLKSLTLFLLIITTDIFGQHKKISLNPKYVKAPHSVARSPIKLAKYLIENDSSEFQKALNIYTWIVHNISYDVKAVTSIKPRNYSAKQTLKRKKGICYQYSNLFTALCLNAGISAREIMGYSRGFAYYEDDRFFEADHSWNGVKLDSSWYLVDATWGSGRLQQKKRWFQELKFRWFKKPYVNNKYVFKGQPNYDYFLADPALLITDHLPVDPNWQLIDFPISVGTFESSNWKSYFPKMDSLYQKEMDSSEYVVELNTYEYLSDLQYLQVTAAQSNVFNPKNLKLAGLSSYLAAHSYENISGDFQKRIETYGHAIQLYKLASAQWKRHQKVALSESNKMRKRATSRISHELIKPLADRIKKNNQEYKRAASLLKKERRVIANHKSRLFKLQNLISKPSRSFKSPAPSRIAKPELVKENKPKIKDALATVINYKDSVSVLMKRLKEHTSRKKRIQMEIVSQYQGLTIYSKANIYSVIHDQRLSEISKSMQALADLGKQIDSLKYERKILNQQIVLLSRTIKQLHASIISYSLKLRKLIAQNCQLSQNKDCNGTLYNTSTEDIKSIYKSKKHFENELLDAFEYDVKIDRKMVALTGDVQDALKINLTFVSLFQEQRLGGISFKLKKSTFETTRWINDCQKSIRRLTDGLSELKKEMKKRKGT